jgi:hypothetical protein
VVGGTAGAVLGPQRTAVLTIVDNDAGGQIQFSVATYTVPEGTAAATITLVRSGGLAGPVTVDFATKAGVGTATALADYTPVSQTITFAAGVTTRTVMVPIVNDTLDRPNEAIVLQLTNPGGGATLGLRDTAVLTIVDNDVAGTVQFSQALYTVSETATSASIMITRSGGAASAVTVVFATSNGAGASGAVSRTDYTATATTVTFVANQVSQAVVIPLAGNDTAAEGNKFVTLTLSNPGGGAGLGARSAAQLKIVDDEGTVQFAAPAYSVTEGATASIVVERTGTAGTVIVPYVTSNGTGAAGTDYVTRSGSLTFAAGVTTLAFPVATISNTRDEGDRTVNLTLGPAVGGTAGAVLGPQRTAVLTIVDDDVAGALAFGSASYNARESGAVTLTVRRSGSTGAGPVEVADTTVGGTAVAGVDYQPKVGVLTFTVVLSAPTGGATLGTPSAASVVILDDDV